MTLPLIQVNLSFDFIALREDCLRDSYAEWIGRQESEVNSVNLLNSLLT